MEQGQRAVKPFSTDVQGGQLQINKGCGKHTKYFWLMLSHLLIDGMFVSPPPPPNSPWNLIPKVLVFGRGTFGRWWGHEGSLHKHDLMKEAPETFPALPPWEDTANRWPSVDQEGASSDILPASWSWTFQSSELWDSCLYTNHLVTFHYSRLNRLTTSLKYVQSVLPWIAQVWTSQVHLHACF